MTTRIAGRIVKKSVLHPLENHVTVTSTSSLRRVSELTIVQTRTRVH